MVGRLPASSLIIIPKNHITSNLYVKYQHISHNHAGTGKLVRLVEKKCYLVGGIQEYKKILRGCQCRMKQLHQVYSDLPIERTASNFPAYTFVACDYAGPFFVYNGEEKKEQKVWVLLICCLVTRHLHVELVEDCTTAAFIQAFRSFIAIRGQPRKAFSDQASYFKSSSKQLKEILRKINWPEAKQRLNQDYSMEWEFFCSHASSKAGVIEVMVRLFKESLEKAMKFTYRCHQTPRYFNTSQFRVICLEMAALVNGRPLGLTTTDKEGMSDILNITPNLLAVGRDLYGLPYNMKLKDVLTRSADVNQVYKDRTKVIRLFWDMYYSNYHRKLKFTPKWTDQFKKDIPEQSYVLIKEKNFKPGKFTPGVVVGVHRRKDGLISRLKIKTAENKGVIERDLRSCFMLENDWLKLSEKGHHCLVQNIKKNEAEEEEVGIPISNQLLHIINEEDLDVLKAMSKRGEERVFSTQTFVQKL